MRKTKREKHRIKAAGHAQALSQEILAGLRRNSQEHVSMDDDSMENIDAYWNMANKELEEMERKQYEDISMLETINEIITKNSSETEKEKEGEAMDSEFFSTPHTIRRSFDDEFQENLQNVVLTGFSDSEEENATSVQEKEKKEKEEETASAIEQSSIMTKEDDESRSENIEKTEESALFFIEEIKSQKDNAEIKNSEVKITKVSIKPKKAMRINSKSLYYIIRGTVIVEDKNTPKKQRVSAVYRAKIIEGRQLKAGSVLSHSQSTVVLYNPGISECTMLALSKNEKKGRKRSTG
ncbi:hypothetical protein NEMIN01_1550 [Nematocida minor]|uniref:uncharacterized protein n=1 Tax=Nematocida minor TaxID=1912983 RepID=UPI002220A5AE|nr:uncharacterized protein NEMIN01_1550 [Nematocida minor]KAI5191524.1 hypothetical protein NEMIN01_1550 [Nematocida minor]